jgi:transposase
MAARHRLSKLLLRHGIVYYAGKAWTTKHDQWLRTDALSQLTARSSRLAFDFGYETVLATKARWDRLDAAIEELAADSEFTPLRSTVGLPAWHRHPDRVRTGRRDRRLAPLQRQHHRFVRRPRPH